MKCLVLADGYATTLYLLTNNFFKPLLEVKEKCILDWLLDDIDKFGREIKRYLILSPLLMMEQSLMKQDYVM